MAESFTENSLHTLACTVTFDELLAIDQIARQSGQTREAWLYALISRTLQDTAPTQSGVVLPAVQAGADHRPGRATDDSADSHDADDANDVIEDEPDEILYDFLVDESLE